MEIFLQPENWIALATLTFLEIVLGVDNIIFISIVTSRIPKHQRQKTRNLGLLLAMAFRIGLLLIITTIIDTFREPLFHIFSYEPSVRDIILFVGGGFLLVKSILEIHHKMEGTNTTSTGKKSSSFISAILQIIALDMVFSFDSILTAIGLSEHVLIMIIAVVIAIFVMMVFAGKISRFINEHPTLQVLALSFLILIGFMLIIDGLNYHVPKGYIYFAVFFSLIVELINMKVRKSHEPIKLKNKELKK